MDHLINMGRTEHSDMIVRRVVVRDKEVEFLLFRVPNTPMTCAVIHIKDQAQMDRKNYRGMILSGSTHKHPNDREHQEIGYRYAIRKALTIGDDQIYYPLFDKDDEDRYFFHREIWRAYRVAYPLAKVVDVPKPDSTGRLHSTFVRRVNKDSFHLWIDTTYTKEDVLAVDGVSNAYGKGGLYYVELDPRYDPEIVIERTIRRFSPK